MGWKLPKDVEERLLREGTVTAGPPSPFAPPFTPKALKRPRPRKLRRPPALLEPRGRANWDDSRVVVELPVVVMSEANARRHWAAKHRRVQKQRVDVGLGLMALVGRQPPPLGRGRLWRVTLRHVYARADREIADDDNLESAFKAVRDQVAAWLGVDDRRRDKLRFRYEQAAGTLPGIRITIEAVGPLTKEVSQ